MSFNDLKLIDPLKKALTKQGYTTPTPIQLKSIPSLLLGKDLIGIAQTGTGKTAAFALPILQRMTEKYPRVIKTLILAPTRELAAQIGESFSAYGEFLRFKHTVIFGGVSQGMQVQALSKGVDIVIATPGRLLDLMNQRRLTLGNVEFFVLDEADRMLDMGFIHDIKRIITRLPEKRQTLFFSATMSPEINRLAKSLLKDPIHVEVTAQATTVEKIKQCVFFIDQNSKEKLLLEFLRQKHLTSVLVFTRTKHKANKVAAFLSKNNISSDAIHGNKSQSSRTNAIKNFKTGKIKVLVATDIAARGIDIDNISHVINFEIPNEPESYVHRIGRTARAGAEGTAFSFCSADERNFLRNIERLIKKNIEVMDHTFHSETAKNAVGAAAKPPPKRQSGRNHRFKYKPGHGSKNKNTFSRNDRSGSRFKHNSKRR
ncbi:MAG: DEAD/DEAH box helicase [Nanoarchaeota archaeon]|nr:DEAD/DEAH box helicase [Nanoarchaeota archaeon]